MAIDQRGWASPVKQFEELRSCVRILMEGKGTFGERMDRATKELVMNQSKDFPERVRGRFQNLLDARAAVRQEYVATTPFYRVRPQKRTELVADIMALYEACLMDLALAGQADFPQNR